VIAFVNFCRRPHLWGVELVMIVSYVVRQGECARSVSGRSVF